MMKENVLFSWKSQQERIPGQTPLVRCNARFLLVVGHERFTRRIWEEVESLRGFAAFALCTACAVIKALQDVKQYERGGCIRDGAKTTRLVRLGSFVGVALQSLKWREYPSTLWISVQRAISGVGGAQNLFRRRH